MFANIVRPTATPLGTLLLLLGDDLEAEDEGLDIAGPDLGVRALDDGVSGKAWVGPVLGEEDVEEGVGPVLRGASVSSSSTPGLLRLFLERERERAIAMLVVHQV